VQQNQVGALRMKRQSKERRVWKERSCKSLCASLLLWFCELAVSLQASSLSRSSGLVRPLRAKCHGIPSSYCYGVSTPTSPVSSILSSSRRSEGDEASFSSSFLYEGTFQSFSDGLLSYLPNEGRSLPPKTRRLVKRITSEYIYGVDDNPRVDLGDVLAVIDDEYESFDDVPVPVVVGGKTFQGGAGQVEHAVALILSLAVLHQLPKEITLRMLGPSGIDNNDITREGRVLEGFRIAFKAGGWEKVSFPKGLALRLKPKLDSRSAFTPNLSFFPPSRLPWRSRSTRKAAEAAQKGVLKAAETQAPERNIMTKEEFLVEIEKEMRGTQLSVIPVDEPPNSSRFLSLGDAPLPSFPSQRYSLAWTKVKRAIMDSSYLLSNNKSWKKFATMVHTQSSKLKQAGRAGLLAYAFLNFIMYTVGMAWQWRRIDMSPVGGVSIATLTMKKFGKAFARVFVVGASLKLGRILVALALAPAAGRALQFTQRKLGVSENTAFVILITLLLKTFFGTLAAVILGDSALRKTVQIADPESLAPSIQEAASVLFTVPPQVNV
jgi:hypothetical protein